MKTLSMSEMNSVHGGSSRRTDAFIEGSVTAGIVSFLYYSAYSAAVGQPEYLFEECFTWALIGGFANIAMNG